MSSQVDLSAAAVSTYGTPKVAIPRLRRPNQPPSVSKGRRRVTRACTTCRTQKIKCSGDRPLCNYCSSANRECVYVISRKDRMKELTERCQQMAVVLQALRPSVNREDNAKITDVLDAVDEDVQLRQFTASPSPSNDSSLIPRSLGTSSGPYRPDEPSVGNPDFSDHDSHQIDVPTPGFVGQNSDVHWLYSAVLAHKQRQEARSHGMIPLQGRPLASGNDKITSFIYWNDDENVDLDVFVDQYELPQPDTAQRLLECYMLKVHYSFPILARKPFEDQFQRHFTAILNGNAPRLNPGWQVILNLVFAIGAKYSHLTQADWRADERDHFLYQARARTLGLSESTITTHPDIPRVQSLGLLAFYWLSIGQVSRAWTIIGLALRFAYSLGLHMQIEDPSIGPGRRETLVHIWWSMCSLERTLCIVTGRPSSINDLYCSVPLPQPVFDEHAAGDTEMSSQLQQRGGKGLAPAGFALPQASSGLYFPASVRLSMVTQDILAWLYSANPMIRPSGEIQQQIVQLSQRLDEWVISLPVELNPLQADLSNSMFRRERYLLGFQLCSARMLLARPYMSKLEQGYQAEEDMNFTKNIASSCVDAALSMMEFWPNEPHLGVIYDQYPWWCSTYHIMQAVSVLLLGITYSLSNTGDNMTLVSQVRKAIRWLRTLQDPVAKRAYRVAVYSFESIVGQHPEDAFHSWAPQNLSGTALQGPSSVGMGPYVPPQFDPALPPPGAYSAFATVEEREDMVMSGTHATQHDPSIFDAPYYTKR